MTGGALRNLLRARQGPMAEDLVLHPGKFGLGMVPAKLQPADTVNAVCGYCSTGCSLKVHVDERGEAINLTANGEYPVNLGMACPKGWEALAPLKADDRAATPLLRGESGRLEPVDWERALLVFCGRMKEIQKKHGPGSVAFLGTGQLPSEDLALLGGLARFGMGFRHGDGNTRQCMATAVTAYKQSFGFDAPPFTYADFEESDVIVLWGSNLCIAHPILWQRVMRNRRSPQIIVVDPRRTETAQAATRHLTLRPGSDLVLAYGLARELLARDAVDRDFVADHTEGFEEFAVAVAGFGPDRVEEETGIRPDELEAVAAAIAGNRRVSFWWTMGVNQGHQATRTAQAIINLALMTGNIGRPGTGANSITGQCNAMGSRLFSNTSSLYGGRDFANPAHRREVAGILGIPDERIPDSAGYAYDQILDAIETGEIRALWVVATNPAHSWIQQGRAREILAKLDFLVVQDMYGSTETALEADLVLPAAGWGEKEGTFINSERRVGRVRKVARAPGSALADFAIFKLIAHYWGCGPLFARWTSPETTFGILKELTRGRPCDITGITDYAHLEEQGGIQWPLPEGKGMRQGAETGRGIGTGDGVTGTAEGLTGTGGAFSERRLFEDGRFHTPNGRARFIHEEPKPLPEGPDRAHPFVLLTGRGTSAQWHTQTRTSKSDVLRKLYPKGIYVEVNAADAARLGIRAGDAVRVRSRRGELVAAAVPTAGVQSGQVFIPMHYHEANRLTRWHMDPYSRQPAYKACAVALERIVVRGGGARGGVRGGGRALLTTCAARPADPS